MESNAFCCKKCGSLKLYIEENGTQCGLYCSDCGKWIKWLGKEEKRLAIRHIQRVEGEELMKNAVPEENELIFGFDLSQVDTDDLIDELRRRIKC